MASTIFPSWNKNSEDSPTNNDENQDSNQDSHQSQKEQPAKYKAQNQKGNMEQEVEKVPNKFSVPEFINNFKDDETGNNEINTAPLSDQTNRQNYEQQLPEPTTIDQQQQARQKVEKEAFEEGRTTSMDDFSESANVSAKNGSMLSPSIGKRYKIKTPTTPTFRNIFGGESPRLEHPNGEANNKSYNNNEAPTSNANDNDISWLKRLSKFNHSEPNFNDWKTNFFPFNKKGNQQTQGSKSLKKNQRVLTKKEKLSESDRLTRVRANILIDSLFLGYTATNLVSSVFLLDEEDTRRAPLLAPLIGVRIYDITDNYYNPRHHHHRHQQGSNQNNLSLMSNIRSNGNTENFNQTNIEADDGQNNIAPVISSREPPVKRRRFRFEMEYGVGDNRTKWTLIKSYKEIAGFAARLRLLGSGIASGGLMLKKSAGKVNIPTFPKIKGQHHTFPDFSDSDSSASDNEDQPENQIGDAIDVNTQLGRDRHSQSSGLERPYNNIPRENNLDQVVSRGVVSSPRPHSQAGGDNASSTNLYIANDGEVNDLTSFASRSSVNSQIHRIISRISDISIRDRRNKYKDQKYNATDYTARLETYFKTLFHELSLKPQSNRLFQFFELSPVGVLLSNENGYKGKQGNLLIATSAKKQGWRVGHLRARDLGAMIKRHTQKWFCIRESYIIYVADINSTTILDVFLVDEKFKLKYGGDDEYISKISELVSENDESEDEEQIIHEETSKHQNGNATPHLNITLENKERKMKMVAKSAHELKLWIKSIKIMQSKTEWAAQKRFNSFAPVRENCFAQWFVDARDYWWAASSAIEMAKDVIFIHDWWLSPELYLRRPANGNQEWRIDRLLKRKAEQGVKIFIIVYRNIGEFVVIDSSWTKHSLMDLHENIRVLRSPNQFLQNTFFWAHHEKLLIVDHTIAFLGGIDLCYGRYDTPEHVLVDDAPNAFAENNKKGQKNAKYQIFPGKDYSNPRVKDFFELNKPYESMYDRQNIPRMPWHDVHMVNAGQIARDLSRHFVQRWNYLIRQKRPSRPTPLLTPPTNLSNKEIEAMGFKGSCEVQLLRSSGYWSLGLKETEHSIQNAYLKLIETSEHFIYIENQFFVTACAWDNIVIKNRVGDALVDRIIRAHKEGRTWRAVIVIPLMPGFEAQVDEPEGSSVRVIMQCQYMSISRGSTSIFAKLRKVGIDPDSYIQFFSLRKWGKIGEYGKLVSEQLYIHAKTMIVDDRVAIIGSANINERSMRGSRDSEICAVIRDTETIRTTMNGKPYLAGKFAHTLRMRLMREHLGIHVDQLELVERQFDAVEKLVRNNYEQAKDQHVTGIFENNETSIRSAMVEMAARKVLNLPEGTDKWKKFQNAKKSFKGLDPSMVTPNNAPLYKSFNHRAWLENTGLRDKKQFSSDPRIKNNETHKADVAGKGTDNLDSKMYNKWKLNARQTLKKWALEATSTKKFKSVFIPDLEKVKRFLDNDDKVLSNYQGKELEDLLAQRDEERWQMLKKVSYLQRVVAKYEADLKQENAKRSKLGMAPKHNPLKPPQVDKSHEGSHGAAHATGDVNDQMYDANGHFHHFDHHHSDKSQGHKVITTANGKPSSPEGLSLDPKGGIIHEEEGKHKHHAPATDTESHSAFSVTKSHEISKKPSVSNESSAPHTEANRDIPITSLNEDQIEELLSTQLKIGKARFVDPYSVSDPLNEEFYEDIWFENAYRNTKIFRLVFHCQPDDTVATWSEYKESHKMMKAFSLAQDCEIETFKDNNSHASEDNYENEEEVSEDDENDDKVKNFGRKEVAKISDPRPYVKKHSTSRSIRLNDLDTDGIGALGMPPSEMRAYNQQQQEQQQQLQQQQKRKKLSKKLTNLRRISTNDTRGYGRFNEDSEQTPNETGNEDIVKEEEEEDEISNSSDLIHTTPNNLSSSQLNGNGSHGPKANVGSPTVYNESVQAKRSFYGGSPLKVDPEENGIPDGKATKNANGTIQSNGNSYNLKSDSNASSLQDQSTLGYNSRSGAYNSHYGNNSSPLKGSATGDVTRKRTGTFSTRRHKHRFHRDMVFDKETAEKILNEISGHLVLFPVNWLYKELESNNWFTNSDRLPPIEIYD